MLVKHHIPHNACFAGIYDFATDCTYSRLLEQFLAKATANTLIMCHPGLANQEAGDVIAVAREKELAYFASDAFKEICERLAINL